MTAQGSYTVEAAWIMTISLSIVCASILLGYEVYREVITYAKGSVRQVDPVTLFRAGALLQDWKEWLP